MSFRKFSNGGSFLARMASSKVCRHLLIIVIFCFVYTPVVWAAAISYGYKTNESIAYGALVSLDKSNPSMVKLSTKEDIETLLGVSVKSNESLLSLSNGTTDIEVAVEGTAMVLVSDINGDIKPGDPITVSPIAGVGMRSPNATKIVGTAQQNFNRDNSGTTKQKITDKDGKDKEVNIGKIPLSVKVETYNGNAQSPANAMLQALQSAVSFIAGRQVPVARALVAVGIVLSSLLICSIIVYTSIRTSFISVGRNPLAQSFIRKNLYVILVTVVSILGIAFVSAYLVIR